MMITMQTWTWLALLGVVIASIGLSAIAWVLVYRIQAHLGQRSRDYQRLQNVVRVILRSDIGVSEQLRTLQKQYQRLEGQHVQLAQGTQHKDAYKNAVKLLALGSNVDAIASASGLSRAEARLLANLAKDTV